MTEKISICKIVNTRRDNNSKTEPELCNILSCDILLHSYEEIAGSFPIFIYDKIIYYPAK